jgi:hypothetical protein
MMAHSSQPQPKPVPAALAVLLELVAAGELYAVPDGDAVEFLPARGVVMSMRPCCMTIKEIKQRLGLEQASGSRQ